MAGRRRVPQREIPQDCLAALCLGESLTANTLSSVLRHQPRCLPTERSASTRRCHEEIDDRLVFPRALVEIGILGLSAPLFTEYSSGEVPRVLGCSPFLPWRANSQVAKPPFLRFQRYHFGVIGDPCGVIFPKAPLHPSGNKLACVTHDIRAAP